MAKLTTEQLEVLSKWEANFRTAVEAQWSAPIPETARQTILNIWNIATGEGRKLQRGCSRCAFQLVRDMGQLYFAEKAAAIDAENDRKAVELSQADATPVKKATVKTAKKTTKSKQK